MDEKLLFLDLESKTPEEILIQLCFYFSVLNEYQLIDLQANVRNFVVDMSNAIQEMDNLVVAEGQSAQSLFESLFNKNNREVSAINSRSAKRTEDIFAEALKKLHPCQTPLETFNSDSNKTHQEEVESEVEESHEGESKIWSEIAKKFESFCRLEERLRPQVYTMIQSLNFEDIQTQRLEHALTAHKKLNQGIVNFIKKGLHNCSTEEVKTFSINLIKNTRASYTMQDERDVFDQVFIKPEKEHK